MAIKEYPIIGYQPDLPPDTPGVLTLSSQCLPTDRGIGNGWGGVLETTAVSTGASCNGAALYKIDGTERVFFGTATKLFEYTAGAPGTVTDRSGAAYNAVQYTQEWSFAQFGDITLAVNKGDTLQEIGAGASFAAVAGAPKASIVITPGLPNAQFAMCFDYNDGVNNYKDGIYWSALSDYTNWTTSIATQCGNVRLTDVNGGFTAAIPFRDGVVAFKAHAMYLGEYVGGSAIWSWTRISNQVGCLGPNAVCEANDAIYFADSQGIWVFDGSYPRLMRGAIHAYWASIANGDARLVWDKTNHHLWVLTSRLTNVHLVNNLRSGLWTYYGTLNDGTNTVDHLISQDYGLKKSATTSIVWLLNKQGTAAQAAAFRIHAMGGPYRKTTIKSVRPAWIKGPSTDTNTTWTTAFVEHGKFMPTLTTATTSATTAAPGRFDMLVTDNYVRPQISVVAAQQWEVSSVACEIGDGGAE